MSTADAVSAANRFGLGARPGELTQIQSPQDWLLSQLAPGPMADVLTALPGSLDYLREEAGLQRQRAQVRRAARAEAAQDAPGNAQALQQQNRRLYQQAQSRELAARYAAAVESERSFAERLVHFWSNHFAISVDKRTAALYAAPMEREAIRPHLTGRFGDMLLAVETHPGMLRYLDNVQSVGTGSTLAQRARRRQAKRAPGLNENLAREILELHTVGVDGGYTQADVTELALAITGWGVPRPQELAQGDVDAAFAFRPLAHEGGTRTLLGQSYADGGLEQGQRMLAALAVHPATAHHVSWKLARHLVSDTPPPALVDAMARTWRETGGALAAVYRTLVLHPAAWGAQARKFKTPDDFVVSAIRAGGTLRRAQPRALFNLLTRMGQPPFTPRSPAGFADAADEWSGPDALWKRVQAAEALSEALPEDRIDPLATARTVFGDRVDPATIDALRRAESARDGLSLLFASPAFQWRS